MLTRVAYPTTPGARPLQTRALVSSGFRPSASSLLKGGHRQQTRAFRFGMWSSYLDPEFQRELQHRHRMLKHKHAETLNRRLSWDQRPLHGHPKAIVKHMLRRYWHPARAKCGSRFANNDELNNRQQHGRATDTGDVRTATPWTYGSWWGGYSSHYVSSPRNYYTWKSQLDEALSHWSEHSSNKTRAESSHYSTKSQPSAEAKPSTTDNAHGINVTSTEDYIIDPITNRKVPRTTYGSVEDTDLSSTDSFKAYRAQFTTFAPPKGEPQQDPIYSDGPPPPAELKEYGQVNVDHVLSDGVNNDGHDGAMTSEGSTENYRHPNLQDNEYALNHLPPEEPVEQYDDLNEYQTYQKDGPDEQVPDSTKKYEDLDQYKTYGPEETEDANPEASRDHKELHDYKPYLYNESVDATKQTTQYDDLNEYGPYKYQEDKAKDEPAQQYEDLHRYEHYNDEGKPVDNPTPKYEDLKKYDTTNFKDSFAEEQPFQQYGDLENYRTFKHQELDNEAKLERDIVAESLKEFDAKEQEVNPAENLPSSIANRLRKLDLSDASPDPSSDSVQTFSSLHQSEQPSTTKTEAREILEQAMVSHNAASDAADREASSNVKRLRTSSLDDGNSASENKLTGNYVRDFPEEFSGSWNSQVSRPSIDPDTEPESRSLDGKTADIQAAEKQYSDQLSRSMNSLKLETSLDRQQAEPKQEHALDQQETQSTKGMFNHHSTTEAEVDPYSREPQGLETSYTRECDGEASSSTFIKTYGDEPLGVVWEHASTGKDLSQSMPPFESLYHRDPEVDGLPISASKSDPKAEPDPAVKPTVYKILAYDPITQNINTAETTSVVPDMASPLTPAEVLLRLSNPTKFFPHFAPLQAEGFEIVSGSGNVLVFRQVRPGKVAHRDSSTPVNPIDMMGKPTALPNAAAFVSPTGFVNYDMPQVEEETQTTPFRSNIDVRREEPVFSGPKSPTAEELRSRKKKSVGRRVLIGGAWVAGISYAIGVVSEYFLTGGADGRGPTGF
ncbi:target of SBF [Hypoxylon texense]